MVERASAIKRLEFLLSLDKRSARESVMSSSNVRRGGLRVTSAGTSGSSSGQMMTVSMNLSFSLSDGIDRQRAVGR
ncbi:hypothetical protein ACFX2I_014990 [Malus domestica]